MALATSSVGPLSYFDLVRFAFLRYLGLFPSEDAAARKYDEAAAASKKTALNFPIRDPQPAVNTADLRGRPPVLPPGVLATKEAQLAFPQEAQPPTPVPPSAQLGV